MRAMSRGLQALPPGVRLVVLAIGLLVAMAGCTAAWIDQQSYVPSPNICRAHETARTDCVHVERPAPTVQQAGVGQ
ncbi:hypothetical protein [Nocardia cyriacigeorgica]|uniref:hypothetical protein n=1 Tax=Nocardia cyriacigeorgica TaxID=135487 RepID=UPI002456A3FA|nr:hypothetical protein [Nocardia cyriacigeorgica]